VLLVPSLINRHYVMDLLPGKSMAKAAGRGRPAHAPAQFESPVEACYLSSMPFPVTRPRRLRQSPGMRALARETTLEPRNFIYPLFFAAQAQEARPIATMPSSQAPRNIARNAALSRGSSGGDCSHVWWRKRPSSPSGTPRIPRRGRM
jgi:hypothetical protein